MPNENHTKVENWKKRWQRNKTTHTITKTFGINQTPYKWLLDSGRLRNHFLALITVDAKSLQGMLFALVAVSLSRLPKWPTLECRLSNSTHLLSGCQPFDDHCLKCVKFVLRTTHYHPSSGLTLYGFLIFKALLTAYSDRMKDQSQHTCAGNHRQLS